MRVVLDANVIVAAFAARGLCETVFEGCLDSHEIVLSDQIVEEVERSLRNSVKLPANTTSQIIRLLRHTCAFYEPRDVSKALCRDPQDLHVLGLAIVADTDYLVTGDKDLLAVRSIGKCKILSPRQFSDLISHA